MADYPESLKEVILNPISFKKYILQCNDQVSFIFPNIINGIDENDHEILGELDFCPDVLFQNRKLYKI